MSSTASRIIKNTGWLYAKMGITMFISLYTTRLILSSLGVTDFGIYNIVGGAINMLGFLNASMAGATQRFMSFAQGQGDKNKQIQIFNIGFTIHLLLSIIVSVVLLFCGFFFFNGILQIPASRQLAAQVIYASLIVSTMFTIANVPYDAVMNAHENMLYYSIIGILEACLKLLVAFICVNTESDKLIVYGTLMACIPFITLTIMKTYCHKQYEECQLKPIKYWNTRTAKEMGKFAGWNLFSTFAMMGANYGLGIVTNYFWGVLLNTALGIAQQVNAQLQVFSSNMLKALNPVITKSKGSGDNKKTIEYSYSGGKFSFFTFVIFAVPFIVETPYILKIWLAIVPNWAVLFCRLQIVATIITQIFVTLPTAIFATGKNKEVSLYTSYIYIGSIVTTFLMFEFGAPPYFMYISVIGLNVCLYYGMIAKLFARLYNTTGSSIIQHLIVPCAIITIIPLILCNATKLFLETGFIRLIIVLLLSSVSIFFLSLEVGTTNTERDTIRLIIINIKTKIYDIIFGKKNHF